jgi:hypothetical protein
MMRWRNAFRLIPIFFKIAYKVFVTNALYHLPWLKKQIQAVEREHHEQLPEYHKRFRLYTIIATIFVTWLETLRNQRLTETQRETALLFCGLTPLFDDLFDEMQYSAEEISLLSQKKIQRGNLHEKVCIALFEQIEQRNVHLNWTSIFQKVIDYQIVSKKQFDKNISREEIIDITFGKGGYSLLLYLEAILPKGYSPAEAEAVYLMGAVIQLTNDVFDTFKDRNEGIFTLATTATDMHALRQYYDSEVAKNIAQFEALPYSKRNIHDFLLQYRLIISRGWVALDQLQVLQTESNNIFTLHDYTRKQLICDMELWRNIRKSLAYTVGF